MKRSHKRQVGETKIVQGLKPKRWQHGHKIKVPMPHLSAQPKFSENLCTWPAFNSLLFLSLYFDIAVWLLACDKCGQSSRTEKRQSLASLQAEYFLYFHPRELFQAFNSRQITVSSFINLISVYKYSIQLLLLTVKVGSSWQVKLIFFSCGVWKVFGRYLLKLHVES